MIPRTLLSCILLSLSTVAAFAQDSADVIVYGSTPGGFCAAIAAAREGASVILLEPTDHVGGLNTGGLSHCDSNQMRRETLMGLFDEWHRRVVKDYTDRGLEAPYNPAFKDNARWTFEPHVAMRVTKAMLGEAGVTVLTGRYLISVTREGPRITSLVTKNGTFRGRVFVDASYEGDLMAAAGVDWTIGREGRAEFGESYAGKRYSKPKMNISGFDARGNLLPLVTTSDAGSDEAGDKNIMTYSFRLYLTRDAEKKVPMPEPASYDPARFELARRALKVGAKVGFDLYPLPGGKIDGNNSMHGQVSLGLVGGGNDWHSADEAGRAKIWEDHKQYTLEFIHFLRTDPVVPPKIRDQFADLGLCKDEFAETGHFSPALYVRESRRMKGMYVLSQKDIINSPEKADPIAISSFPSDSHDCQRVALKDGGVINKGTIYPVRVPGAKLGYAYHVPYRSVLPQAAQCINLLVPVALSCTHVGISSLPIEGAWMVIGQGAGVAAALAAMDFNPTFLEAFGLPPLPNTHASSLWPVLSGKTDQVAGRKSVLTEANGTYPSFKSQGRAVDAKAARAVCDGRFYYIANIIQERTTLPEEKAVNIGTGFGEYGDSGPQYAMDLHDETVRQKTAQPVPYELLRQLCMGDSPKEELYDLESDPWGVKNLATDPAHATTLATMRAEMKHWREFTGDRDVHPKTISRRTQK